MHLEEQGPLSPLGSDAPGQPREVGDLRSRAPEHTALYAIACQGRQGSTYLERILDAHPQVQCAGEIFSDYAFKGHGAGAIEEQLLIRVFSSDKAVVGFKLSAGDLMRHQELAGIVRSFGFKIILLTRENLLDQFISFQLAILNGAYVAEMPGKGITKFSTSHEELKRGFENLAFTDLAMSALVAGLPSLPITYEALIRPESQIQIFEFLGVDPMIIEPRSTKQRSGGQKDAIENYDAMKEVFADTRWAKYFVE